MNSNNNSNSTKSTGSSTKSIDYDLLFDPDIPVEDKVSTIASYGKDEEIILTCVNTLITQYCMSGNSGCKRILVAIISCKRILTIVRIRAIRTLFDYKERIHIDDTEDTIRDMERDRHKRQLTLIQQVVRPLFEDIMEDYQVPLNMKIDLFIMALNTKDNIIMNELVVMLDKLITNIVCVHNILYRYYEMVYRHIMFPIWNSSNTDANATANKDKDGSGSGVESENGPETANDYYIRILSYICDKMLGYLKTDWYMMDNTSGYFMIKIIDIAGRRDILKSWVLDNDNHTDWLKQLYPVIADILVSTHTNDKDKSLHETGKLLFAKMAREEVKSAIKKGNTSFFTGQTAHVVEGADEIIAFLLQWHDTTTTTMGVAATTTAMDLDNRAWLNKLLEYVDAHTSNDNAALVRITISRIESDHRVCSILGISLWRILYLVVSFILSQLWERREAMFARLVDELLDMVFTCSSGYFKRLVNALCGFSRDEGDEHKGVFQMRIPMSENIKESVRHWIQTRIMNHEEVDIMLEGMCDENDDSVNRNTYLNIVRKWIPELTREMIIKYNSSTDLSEDMIIRYVRDAVSAFDTKL